MKKNSGKLTGFMAVGWMYIQGDIPSGWRFGLEHSCRHLLSRIEKEEGGEEFPPPKSPPLPLKRRTMTRMSSTFLIPQRSYKYKLLILNCCINIIEQVRGESWEKQELKRKQTAIQRQVSDWPMRRQRGCKINGYIRVSQTLSFPLMQEVSSFCNFIS